MACASAQPPAPPPEVKAVPLSAVEAMCVRIHDEGIAAETPVDLIATTRPLVSRASLQALAEAAFHKGKIDQAAVDAAFDANRNIVPVQPTPTCSWHVVPSAARRSPDTMTLELSAPFLMPFGRSRPAGMLARLSLAGEAASWYWIPLTNRDGRWIAGMSIPLGLHE